MPPTKTPAASIPIRCRIASTWARTRSSTPRCAPKLIGELWPKVIDEVTKNGDGYQQARQAFGVLLGNHGRAMYFASRYVGGVYVNRGHKGDANGQAPFVVVEPAKQREALALLEEQVFSDKPFQFPARAVQPPGRRRAGTTGAPTMPLRTDYPVHEVIAMWQDRILQQLLSSLTLDRLHDSRAEGAGRPGCTDHGRIARRG